MGELQAFNWSINGSLRRLFSIFSSYAFREASKIAFRLEEEGLEAVGAGFDIVVATKRGLGSERMMVTVWVKGG